MPEYENNTNVDQIALLHDLGIRIFGSKEKFNIWLEVESPALGNVQPKELLKQINGVDLIKNELIRIEHGILA